MEIEEQELQEADKYKFLCRFIKAYDCHVPFQNLSHCTVPFEERHTPTLQVEKSIDKSKTKYCNNLSAVIT